MVLRPLQIGQRAAARDLFVTPDLSLGTVLMPQMSLYLRLPKMAQFVPPRVKEPKPVEPPAQADLQSVAVV